MKQNYLLIISLTLFLASCATGKKQLEQGNYNLAVYQSVKKLQQKPGHEKASMVLPIAYELAVKERLRKVQYYDNSNERYKWVKMAEEYEEIQRMNNAIMRYPNYPDLLELVDVSQELIKTRQEASKSFYSRGVELMEINDMSASRQAYHEFQSALSYDPGNTVIEQRIAEAREAGTLNLALEFPSNETNAYLIPTTDLYYAVINEARARNFTFLRVVDPNDVRFEPHQILRMNLDNISIGQVFVRQEIEQVSKDSVKLGEVQINDSTRMPVYGEVKATIRTYTKTLNSSGILMLQRIDALSGSVLNQTRIPASYNWTSQWADFRGDERALNNHDWDMVNRPEPIPPSPQWLFVQMSRPLLSQTMRIFNDTYGYLR